MKIKEFCKGKKKRIIIIAVSMATVLIITAGVAIYCLRREAGENVFLGGGGNHTFLAGNSISASGVTSVGTTQVDFEVENLTVGLDIEEIYVSSGEEIEEGTAILKLSQESVTKARKELEKTLLDANLAYRAGTIAYEQSLITAEYERDSALLAGQQAQQVYDETISGLESRVNQAKEALAEAQEQIAEYQSYVNDGSYRSFFKVDEYQTLYDENLKVLTDKMDEWGVSWSQVTGGGNVQMGNSVSGGNLSSQYIQVLKSLYSVLEQNARDLEQAQSDYEDAAANAPFNLQTLELQLPSLEQAVTEAQETYETELLQAKLTYETTLANAERADSDYHTAVEKAQSDYDMLKDTYEDAKENLELFESSVGDGYFYAPGKGSILRTMVQKEQPLNSDSTIFIYSNPEEMSVTVSVDQTDIAQIQVGDSAIVQSSGAGSLQGTVTLINPVTVSDSRTSVTYNVTVTLTGDTGSLTTNQSVTVLFGLEQ